MTMPPATPAASTAGASPSDAPRAARKRMPARRPRHLPGPFFLRDRDAGAPWSRGCFAHEVAKFSPHCGNPAAHALNIPLTVTVVRAAPACPPASGSRGARSQACEKPVKNRFHDAMRERAEAREYGQETTSINRGVAYVFTGVFLLQSRLHTRLRLSYVRGADSGESITPLGAGHGARSRRITMFRPNVHPGRRR